MAQRTNTTGTLGTALDGNTLNVAYILRLDIATDPVFAWTGFGTLTFGASETGDSALDGQSFAGITHLVAEIGAVEDAQGGSNGLEITLPAVDLQDEAMKQIIYDQRKWQFLPARVWLIFLDDNGVMIGKPVRLRSGKMDQIKIEESDEGQGILKLTVESQQAYAGEALGKRYSEQAEIDPTDNSQQYVWQLANMNPMIGKRNILGAGAASGSGGSSGGSGMFYDALVRAGRI